jgi:hypothetical protein
MPLFLCCLVHDADAASENIPSSEMMRVNNKFEMIWEETICPTVSYCHNIFPDRLRKSNKTQNNYCPSQNSNHVAPE